MLPNAKLILVSRLPISLKMRLMSKKMKRVKTTENQKILTGEPRYMPKRRAIMRSMKATTREAKIQTLVTRSWPGRCLLNLHGTERAPLRTHLTKPVEVCQNVRARLQHDR